MPALVRIVRAVEAGSQRAIGENELQYEVHDL